MMQPLPPFSDLAPVAPDADAGRPAARCARAQTRELSSTRRAARWHRGARQRWRRAEERAPDGDGQHRGPTAEAGHAAAPATDTACARCSTGSSPSSSSCSGRRRSASRCPTKRSTRRSPTSPSATTCRSRNCRRCSPGKAWTTPPTGANSAQQVTIDQLRQRDVLQRINVSPKEVDAYLARQEGKASLRQEFLLSHILIAVPASATPGADRWPRNAR